MRTVRHRYFVKGFSLLFALSTYSIAANAMEFKTIIYFDKTIGIEATGPIIPGDAARFGNLIASFSPERRQLIRGISLNSGGGSALDGEALALLIHRSNIKVAVLGNDECASACFMLFAAAKYKFASPSARIGGHQPRVQGQHDRTAEERQLRIDVGIAMVQDLQGYGVPEPIIFKFLSASPDEMAWLTNDELRSMGVKILVH